MEVYLDNASTTKMDDEVVSSMLPYFTKNYGNPSSVHNKGLDSKKAVENAREIIAKAINADKEEIIFVSGATEANNLALNNRIVFTTRIEHPSILKSITNPKYLTVDKEGFVELGEIEENSVVSIAHANHEIGTLQQINNIGKICREKNALFHTDASQSFTKEIIDVKNYNIDLMTLNSHKIHGPKGIGVLFVRNGVKINKLFHGGRQESDLRSGTENVPGIVGFGKAVEIAMRDFDKNRKSILSLRNKLIDKLNAKLNGPREKRLINNVNVCFDFDSETMLNHLNNFNIYSSSGSACTSDEIEPSKVLKEIGLNDKQAVSSVRFSLSKFNTVDEIDYTIEKVREILESLEKL